MSAEITISLPDGASKTLPSGSNALDLAASIGKNLAKSALAAEIDGELVDLLKPLPKKSEKSEVKIITENSPEGLEIIRHSTAHVLAQAVLSLYPGATFAIGPAIENGFYYDFQLPDGKSFSDEDLLAIDEKMREIIKFDQPFLRFEISAGDALELFSNHPYKCEIIQTVSEKERDGDAADLMSEIDSGDSISYYKNGEDFLDLCRGPHVPSTGRLGHFMLEKIAGAYWRGNEKLPVLQRIYGTAWSSDKELKDYLKLLEEASKRDHRRLTQELDLISWPRELGQGLAVWHPKGAIVRNIIENYSREKHLKANYDLVYSPHIAKSTLWETSGHLDFYAESMYPPMELEGSAYYPKPMNCPFHLLAFSSTQRSYRQLPIRLFELGTVYRYEPSGTLHGLMRTRGFTQDDSHIFCTREQVAGELSELLDFSLSLLKDFGFTEFQAKLSTRPRHKSVGEDSLWDLAQQGLERALTEANINYVVDEGGGAFYGPKIDVDVKDAIGRNWQLSTIQVDFNLPEQFDLSYTGADGKRHRPVMIHRALMGSIERFFGILVEQYSGAFPLWLAPEQIRILPVADAHLGYARELEAELKQEGFRANVDAALEPLSKRIRSAKIQKLPYILVVGDEDVSAHTAGVNARGSKEAERGVKISSLIDRMARQLEEKS